MAVRRAAITMALVAAWGFVTLPASVANAWTELGPIAADTDWLFEDDSWKDSGRTSEFSAPGATVILPKCRCIMRMRPIDSFFMFPAVSTASFPATANRPCWKKSRRQRGIWNR